MAASPLTSDNLHQHIVATTVAHDLTDLDAFLLFAIMHLYKIVLRDAVLHDVPHGRELAPLTQRGAADVLASVWAHTPDERNTYLHWYWKWNTDWKGYEHIGHLTSDEYARLVWLKGVLESHPLILKLEEEDPGIIGMRDHE